MADNWQNLIIQCASSFQFKLPAGCLEQFGIYLEEFLLWNERSGLSAHTGREEIVTHLILDALPLAVWIRDSRKPDVLDIGTGAGIPGLPLKFLLPELKVTLVEATAKKTVFLDNIAGKLALREVTILTARAEELGHKSGHRERYSLVTAKALTELNRLLELAFPFLVSGGRLLALKGPKAQAELDASRQALKVLAGTPEALIPYILPGLEAQRFLMVIHKHASTPGIYPRAFTHIKKNPL